MKRKIAERKIAKKLKEIKDIMVEYGAPEYLSLTISDGDIMFWNQYYGKHKNKPLNYWGHIKEDVK